MPAAPSYAETVRDDLIDHCDGLGMYAERMDHRPSQFGPMFPAVRIDSAFAVIDIAVRPDGALFDIDSGHTATLRGYAPPDRREILAQQIMDTSLPEHERQAAAADFADLAEPEIRS